MFSRIEVVQMLMPFWVGATRAAEQLPPDRRQRVIYEAGVSPVGLAATFADISARYDT